MGNLYIRTTKKQIKKEKKYLEILEEFEE